MNRETRSLGMELLQFAVKVLLICGLVLGQGGRGYHGNPDSMVYPGPISSRSRSYFNGTAGRIGESDLSRQLRLARMLDSIESYEEFLNLVQDVPQAETTYFGSRIGGTEERSNAQPAQPAKCMPELQSVRLNVNSDPSTLYYPPCTRVKRCGGCCNHPLLSCQPTARENRNFIVEVVKIDENRGLRRKEKIIVALEEHTKCACDCRTKAKDCNEKQRYEPDECRCICNNFDEEEKCRSNNETKIWNPESCVCACRHVLDCNTGYYFDHVTCSCKPIPLSRFWSTTRGTDYRFGQTKGPENVPPVIVSLDAADPRRQQKEDPEYK